MPGIEMAPLNSHVTVMWWEGLGVSSISMLSVLPLLTRHDLQVLKVKLFNEI